MKKATVKQNKKPVFKSPLAPENSAKAFLKSLLHERKYLGICFILPALLMWVIYMCMQVFPFGDNSVLVLDLNGQYVYFFEELKNILHGDGSFLYSFSRALGGEFFGIFAYYLASPFSFIVALFPDSMITEALLIMFLLKTGACGLTFGIYIDSTRKRAPISTVIFSSMYALCGYAVVMQHNTMWIDNLILLPIIMLGIENLIKYGRYKMFVISLTFAVFSNFYIGYMTCIFVALYFFYYYFACTPKERNPMEKSWHFLKSFGRIAVFSTLALAICAVLLLTTYYSLTFGKTEFSNPRFDFAQKFDWADMISKFYFGSYDTVRPEGLPFLYSGMLTLILAPLYFFAPHIKTREKISTAILLVVFFVSFNSTTLDLVWHGFQRPNWLNYRYSFILCFILILMAYKAFERLREIGYSKAIGTAAIIAGVLVYLQKLELTNIPDLLCVWASLAICFIYLLVLRAAAMDSAETRKTAALVLAILVSLEMFCAGLANVVALDKDVVFSSRVSYQSFRERVSPIVKKIQAGDSSFYRMEKTVHRKTNDPYLLDMNGFSGSTSTLNQETITLLNKFGLSSKAHWTKYLGGTPVFDSLFGIKYLVCEKDDSQPLYDYMYTYNEDLAAYQNPYALPIAYGVSSDVSTFNLLSDKYYSPFERMNMLVTKMLGEEEPIKLFKSEPVADLTTTNATESSIASHSKYVPTIAGTVASVNYSLVISDTDTLYCYFPSDYPREVKLFVNGIQCKDSSTFYGNESHRIVKLGSFQIGETVTVKVQLTGENLYIRENQEFFYYLDSEAFKTYMPRLKESTFQIEDFTESSFEGKINVKEGDELIFTTIAHDKGWKVYIDGKKVDTFKVCGGLLGFYATKGEHTLEMKYRPESLTFGIALTSFGILLFALIWFLDCKMRREQISNGRLIFENSNEIECEIDENAFELALNEESDTSNGGNEK